jgi:hypothetical protein
MPAHSLKTHPGEFQDTKAGLKLAEFRLDDRDYQVGDVLILEEWDPETRKYTNDVLWALVRHVQRGGKFGIPDGYVMMSIDVEENAMKVERAKDEEADVNGAPIEVRISLNRKDAEELAALLPEGEPGDTLKTASFGAKLRLALEVMGFRRRR